MSPIIQRIALLITFIFVLTAITPSFAAIPTSSPNNPPLSPITLPPVLPPQDQPVQTSKEEPNYLPSVAVSEKQEEVEVEPQSLDSIDLSSLPLSFVPNRGQDASDAQFIAQAMGGLVKLLPDGLALTLPVASPEQPLFEQKPNEVILPSQLHSTPTTELRVIFDGANQTSQIRGSERLPGVMHYYNGSADKSFTHLPTYQGVDYKALYPGIDLHYDGANGQLKSTYTIAAHVDPTVIRWRYQGAIGLDIDPDGDLKVILAVLSEQSVTKDITLIEQAPIAWQTFDKQRVPVEVSYQIFDDSSVGFVLGSYDHSLPLIIDPVYIYESFSPYHSILDIELDTDGNVYLIGQIIIDYIEHGFIIKLSNDLSTFLYTFIYKGSDWDRVHDLAVGSDGSVAITGFTYSRDLMRTNKGLSITHGSSDAFVALFSPNGLPVYDTYLAGGPLDMSASSGGSSVAIDDEGMIYVTGWTDADQFITSPDAFQTERAGDLPYPYRDSDAFITKIDPSKEGTAAIIYSTYLGSIYDDGSADIEVDSQGYAYISGTTEDSNSFPGNWLGSTTGGNEEIFITKLNQNGTDVEYSVKFGGTNGDIGGDIQIDKDGNVYITGYTRSSNFPQVNGLPEGYHTGSCAYLPCADVFVSKINNQGTELLYSTLLGGNDNDYGYSIALDINNSIYITGSTHSDNFPLYMPMNSSLNGFSDAFLVHLNTDASGGDALLYSTYIGGDITDEGRDIEVDANGMIYFSGITSPVLFIHNAFIARLAPLIQLSITDAAGQDVRALKLNEEGWPSLNAATNTVANPITVTMTINNISANDQIFVPQIQFGSSNNQARFYIFDSPPTCELYPEFSYTEVSKSCFIEVTSESSQILTWGIWVQPSLTSTLVISSSLVFDSPNKVIRAPIRRLDIPQASINPVVFVHGILGSMPPQNKLLTNQEDMYTTLDPFLGSYWSLMDQLQKFGYEWDKTLFAQAYDWRQSNQVSASVLADSLATVQDQASTLGYVSRDSGVIKTDLVVHSMGGLVARAFIQSGLYPDPVDGIPQGPIRKVIFIATPHKGFPFDYQTWEGLTWKNYLYNAPWYSGNVMGLLGSFMDSLIWPVLIKKKYSPTDNELAADCITNMSPNDYNITYKRFSGDNGIVYYCHWNTLAKWAHSIDPNDPGAINRGTRSLFEMLPTNNLTPTVGLTRYYLIEQGSNTIIPFGQQENTYLQDLNQHIKFQLEERLGLENIYVIYGDNASTEVQYLVSQKGEHFVLPPGQETVPDMWRNGVVEQSGVVQRNVGDDLIPAASLALKANGLLSDLPASNEQAIDDAISQEYSFGPSRHKEIVYQMQVQNQYLPRFLGVISSTTTLPFNTPGAISPLALELTDGGSIGTMLGIISDCPINLLITDPQGRRLGYNPSNGQVFREIPNAVYTNPNIEPQIILISNPITGTYTITSTGYDSGQYSIQASVASNEGVIHLTDLFSGTTSINDLDIHTFNYPFSESQGSPTPTSIPTTGPSPTPSNTPTQTTTPTTGPSPTPSNTPTQTNTPTIGPSPTPSNTPTTSYTTALTFTTIADARVEEEFPSTNYGTSSRLTVDADDDDFHSESYLRFDINGLTSFVQQVRLRLYAIDNTNDGTAVYTTTTSWTENTITWANRPAPGAIMLDNVLLAPSGTWVEYDVTTAINGNGSYAFKLIALTDDGVDFSSREGSFPPQLVVIVNNSGTTPTATATPTVTATPTIGVSPTATATPTVTATPTIGASATATATSTATPTSGPSLTPTQTATATMTRTPTATPSATPSGGTRIKDITFEHGSLTHATSGFDSTSGTIALETGSPLQGSYSAHFNNVSSAYLQEQFTATNDVFVSMYIRLSALPSGDVRIMHLSNSGTTVGNIQVRADGTLRLRNDSTAIGSSIQLSTNTLYRIGLRQRQGSGNDAVLEAYLAVGNAAFNTPFAILSNGTWTTAADRLRVGATSGAAINLIIDDIRIDSAVMPGP